MSSNGRTQRSFNPGNISRAEQLNFSANVQADDGEKEQRIVQFDGKHISLLYDADEALRNNLGVKMKHLGTGEKVFPGDRETEFINLAGVTNDFILVFDVSEGDRLEVTYENRDSEAHYLNVISTIAQFDGSGGGA